MLTKAHDPTPQSGTFSFRLILLIVNNSKKKFQSKISKKNGRVAASTRSPLIGCLISQVAKVAANEILDIAHVLILQSRAQIYVRLSELVGPLALFSLAVGEICLLER